MERQTKRQAACAITLIGLVIFSGCINKRYYLGDKEVTGLIKTNEYLRKALDECNKDVDEATGIIDELENCEQTSLNLI